MRWQGKIRIARLAMPLCPKEHMTPTLSVADLWSDLAAVRERSPLGHCITNLVVINFNANVLLAAGASSAVAHAHEEVRTCTGRKIYVADPHNPRQRG